MPNLFRTSGFLQRHALLSGKTYPKLPKCLETGRIQQFRLPPLDRTKPSGRTYKPRRLLCLQGKASAGRSTGKDAHRSGPAGSSLTKTMLKQRQPHALIPHHNEESLQKD